MPYKQKNMRFIRPLFLIIQDCALTLQIWIKAPALMCGIFVMIKTSAQTFLGKKLKIEQTKKNLFKLVIFYPLHFIKKRVVSLSKIFFLKQP
ncbi:MAG: hypothetical protein FADNKDHG_01299 [Holosporales bacterium]